MPTFYKLNYKDCAFVVQTRWSRKESASTQCVSIYTIEVSNSLFSKRCTLEVKTQLPVHDFEAELEEANVRPPGKYESSS